MFDMLKKHVLQSNIICNLILQIIVIFGYLND